jgi:DNA-binding transcriptional ArsR family regulator
MTTAAITDLDALKVFSDPFRHRIVELLAGEPQTTKELATTLDVDPHRLYYHLNLLEKHGFIEVTETHVVSGIVEKVYRAVARRFAVQWNLITVDPLPGDPALEALFDDVLHHAEEDARASVDQQVAATTAQAPNPAALLGRRVVAHLSPGQATAFYDRLLALLRDFAAETTPGADTQPYELAALLFPQADGGSGDDGE